MNRDDALTRVISWSRCWILLTVSSNLGRSRTRYHLFLVLYFNARFWLLCLTIILLGCAIMEKERKRDSLLVHCASNGEQELQKRRAKKERKRERRKAQKRVRERERKKGVYERIDRPVSFILLYIRSTLFLLSKSSHIEQIRGFSNQESKIAARQSNERIEKVKPAGSSDGRYTRLRIFEEFRTWFEYLQLFVLEVSSVFKVLSVALE